MMKNQLFLFLIAFMAFENSIAQLGSCKHNKHVIQRGGSSLLDDLGNLRSDTLDILGYDITLDMTLMNSSQISATCTIDFQSLMNNIDWINLDLLDLTVDSVTSNNEQLSFNHVNGLLHTELPVALNIGDTYVINVHYHGSPASDATWGGFYFSSGYAYNLGVAFTSEPHNFGRAWFPCFDNFVERSTYDFHVLTNQNRTAYCNGIRTGIDEVGLDSIITHWSLQEQIPSYLACVAVTNYVTAQSSFQSVSGDDIPIWLTAKAVDTTDMKQSMTHLAQWMEGAEDHYGPYRWPRVGYCAVPFSGGAMEHATNIAYPIFACDGSLVYESLYAHEVSHHWWGDLVTCRNACDMWLNEGWASYSESLFQEIIYGEQAYIDNVRANHKDVLLHAHRRDNGRYPVSPVPSAITYGDHTYNKGADVAHTLRGYMGEIDFFNGIQAFMEAKAFSDISSEDLRDFMQEYTDADLTAFFHDWVFEAGFPEFRVKNFTDLGSNQFQVTVEQHGHYTSDLYSSVPMQLSAINESGEISSQTILLNGEISNPVMTLAENFEPVAFFLNMNDAISQAVLGETKVLAESGSDDFDFAEMDIDILSMGSSDSIFMRVENHWAEAADNSEQIEYFISPDRWWNVYHNGDENSLIDGKIRYYGTQGQTNYYDTLFFDYVEAHGLNEDSLVLLYRENGMSLWQEFDDYQVVTTPSLTNWTGRFDIHNIRSGQYAWAVRTGLVSSSEMTRPSIKMYASQNRLFVFTGNNQGHLQVTDISGKIIIDQKISIDKTFDTSRWSSGIYFVNFTNDSTGESDMIKFQIN